MSSVGMLGQELGSSPVATAKSIVFIVDHDVRSAAADAAVGARFVVVVINLQLRKI